MSCTDNRPDVVEAFTALSAEETTFVYAYCNSFNATEAYLAVVPDSERRNASNMGWDMMRRPQVKTAVSLHLEERKANYELDFRLILHNLLAVANANVVDILDVDGYIDLARLKDAPIELQVAVEMIEQTTNSKTGDHKRRIKLCDKLKAAELIGKHLKMWTEKVELGGVDGKELAFTVTQKPFKAETDDKR